MSAQPYLRSAPLRLSMIERLLLRATMTEAGCWEVPSSGNGYAQMGSGERGGHVYAHRAMYEHVVGPIPAGREIDHLCRNRSCVNPEHLEPVTRQENQLRTPRSNPTHCPHGHDLTPDNVGRRRNRCLTCHRERERNRRNQEQTNA